MAQAQVGSSHAAICQAAERHFRAIQEAVAARAAPATLKSAFLEPLARDLACELAIHVFARADADFMALFVGELARNPQIGIWGCSSAEMAALCARYRFCACISLRGSSMHVQVPDCL